MLKLPAILCGVAMILWGAILRSAWLLVPGLAILGLGLFFFRWDFGVVGGRREATDGRAEPGAAADRGGMQRFWDV